MVGGGGGLQYRMPECVCWGSENAPIMKDSVGKKYKKTLKGFSAHFIPISWSNIMLKCIIHKRLVTIHHLLINWYSLC